MRQYACLVTLHDRIPPRWPVSHCRLSAECPAYEHLTFVSFSLFLVESHLFFLY